MNLSPYMPGVVSGEIPDRVWHEPLESERMQGDSECGSKRPGMLPAENSGRPLGATGSEVPQGWVHETERPFTPHDSAGERHPDQSPEPGVVSAEIADPASVLQICRWKSERSGDCDRKAKLKDLEEGIRRAMLVQQARSLVADGLPWPKIGKRLGIPYATLFRWYASCKHEAVPTPETLAPKTANSGRRPKTQLTEADQAKLRSIYLRTNRGKGSGSSQEAARIALRAGILDPELAAEVQRRQASGMDLLPDRIRQAITSAPSEVLAHRNPGEARLAFGNTSGTMRWVVDKATGEQRIARAGDVWESDDGSINLIVCIPWNVGGCKTSERHGVKVGRFQWLPMLDAGTSYILGYTYTARPKNSYRAEDILALMRSMFSAHGIPRRLRFERGTWEAKAVDQVIDTLAIERWTAWSPRQKLIENLFGTLWTKLSILPGQIGRFQGEHERENDLLVKARAGTIDPRDHFRMLGQVLQAMDCVIGEKNQTPVESDIYGTWIPAERWAMQRDEGRLHPWRADTSWLFAPCRRELTIRGGQLVTSVAVTDDWSVQYHYSAAELHKYEGKRAALYFDPFAARCEGTAVLLDNTASASSGEVIGTVFQIDQVARHARKMLGWGDDADLGKQVARDTRHDMVRASRAALPDGTIGLGAHEIRLPEGRTNLLPQSNSAAAAALPTRANPVDSLTPASADDYAAARARRASRAAALATLVD